MFSETARNTACGYPLIAGLSTPSNPPPLVMPEPNALPKGLVFFPPNTPAGRRRRRLVFVAIWMAAALALVWPVYPLASGVFPLILGLPLSLAWPVGWLALMFAALVWLYRSEE